MSFLSEEQIDARLAEIYQAAIEGLPTQALVDAEGYKWVRGFPEDEDYKPPTRSKDQPSNKGWWSICGEFLVEGISRPHITYSTLVGWVVQLSRSTNVHCMTFYIEESDHDMEVAFARCLERVRAKDWK